MDKTPPNKILHKIRAKAIEENKEEQDINIFGLIDNYLCRNIANNLRDYYDIKYNKKNQSI